MSGSVKEEAGSLNHVIKVGAALALAECNGPLAATYGPGIVSQYTNIGKWSEGRLEFPVLVFSFLWSE